MGWIDVIYCESRGDIIIQGGVSLYKGSINTTRVLESRGELLYKRVVVL